MTEASPPRGRGHPASWDIAGIGDVYANANEWLAGPTAPSRIEGISIEWPTKPDGVDIRYSVKTAQPLNISGRIVDLGAFVGTRGRAMALTGLMLELSGPDASLYQFSAEALFLGSPVMRVNGERVVVSGPTGREPWLGCGWRFSNKQCSTTGCSGRPSCAKQTERSAAATAEPAALRPPQHRSRRFVRPRSRFPQPA